MIKPILFNTEMVRAILDGRKTVTRRAVRQAENSLNSQYCKEHPETPEKQIIKKLCMPPYQVGDVLYVRETWQYIYDLDGNENMIEGSERYVYAADGYPPGLFINEDGCEDSIKWRPSIHMPREAARIWLKVTDVSVERLWDIDERGAESEGAIDNRGFIHSPDNEYHIHTAREHFSELWDSTIKKSDLARYGWDVNPWVWVIRFERIEKPEEDT